MLSSLLACWMTDGNIRDFVQDVSVLLEILYRMFQCY